MLVKGHTFLAAISHDRIRYRVCRECAGDHAHASWRQSPSTWALCIGYQAAEIRRISGASRLLSKARRAMRIAPSKGSLCGRTRNCFTRLGNQGAKGSARPPIRLIVEVPPATRRSIMRAAKPAVSCTSSTAKEFLARCVFKYKRRQFGILGRRRLCCKRNDFGWVTQVTIENELWKASFPRLVRRRSRATDGALPDPSSGHQPRRKFRRPIHRPQGAGHRQKLVRTIQCQVSRFPPLPP